MGAIELTSPVERLELIGRISTERVWEAIGSDIEKLAMECNTTVRKTGTVSWKLDAEITVRLPVRWFPSGGVKIEVGLMDGARHIATLSEDAKLRRAVAGDCVELRFPVAKEMLTNVDSFALEFRHPRYPSSMVFASRSPYLDTEYARVVGSLSLAGKFAADRLCDDLALYEIAICGKVFRRDIAKNGGVCFSEVVTVKNWQNDFSSVFKNLMIAKKGHNETKLSYVADVNLGNDGILIHYENKCGHAVKPKVSVFLLNRYGAIVGRVDDIWVFKKLEAGAKSVSKKFILSNVDKIAYIDVECE